jgi:transposase
LHRANTAAGYQRLWRWLQTAAAGQPLTVTLEATGGYEEAVATFLHDQGCLIYRVNPYRVKRWAEGALVRTKTDAVDAGVLAEFGRTATKLYPWTPVPPAFRELQGLVRARAALQASRQAFRNRQHAPGVPAVVADVYAATIDSLTAQLAVVEAQIRTLLRSTATLRTDHRLLTSIIGIGHDRAALLLGEVSDGAQFTSGKQLAAFAGLSVQEGESGTSVHKRPRLSKRGSSRLRAALYFPAITAKTHNPHLRAFAARLAARGKCKLAIIGAVMRKLCELVYAILRTGHPFTRDYQHPRSPQPTAAAG